MYRAGFDRPAFDEIVGQLGSDRANQLLAGVIPTKLIDISSTDIRKKFASGEDTVGLIPKAVAKYIRQEDLYR